ncbi:hypothetical protein V5T82_13555 [Magnetovibrio sp. PR-2]|uniref:hypothetical protein n=1 Tax=Magnetovibrio sp. PR-2 TaxID=3120356 RepID=UPI002FCE40A1
MGKMNIATFENKQPLEDEQEPHKPLTQKLKEGEAVKTSLYLDPETHRRLHYLALDLSYANGGQKTKRKQVRVNDLILEAISMYLRKKEGQAPSTLDTF